MAIRTPPAWLQAGAHPAEHDRLLIGALVPAEGVVGFGDLAAAPAGAPDMTVDVAAGAAFVRNDLATHGGTYHVYNDATVNLPIAPADPTNPRKDLVAVRIRDSIYAGGDDDAALVVLAGAPAASPAEPAVPLDGSYLVVALVDVPAGATAITSGLITDRRPRAAVPANNALPVGATIDYAGGGAPAGWLVCDGSAVSRTAYAALFAAIGTSWGGGDGSSTFNLPDSRGRAAIGAGQGAGLTARTVGQLVGAQTHALALSETPAHSHAVASHSHAGSSVVGESGHVHALNHGHPLTGGNHSHGIDNDYGNRIPVTVADGAHVIPNDTGQAGQQVSFTDIDHEPVLSPADGGTALAVTSQNGNSQGGANHGHGLTIGPEAPGTNNQGGGGAHNNMQPSAVFTKLIKAF